MSRMQDCMSGRAVVVGVSLIKTPSDSPRSCAISGSSREVAVCWLLQDGCEVVYVDQAERMTEKNASLGTLRHSSGLFDKLPCTPLKLSILPARNQLCMKLPLLTSGAMQVLLRRLVLVEKGGLSAAACSCSRKL